VWDVVVVVPSVLASMRHVAVATVAIVDGVTRARAGVRRSATALRDFVSLAFAFPIS
jgi:hypothetical protein